jgi:hypothetical protein
MTAPIRISAFKPITADQELSLARELVQIQSEQELDRFIPLLIPAIKFAAPLLMKVAGPLLKGLAGSLLGGGAQPPARPRSQQEHFLGGIIGKLFGAREAESEEEQQFLGSLLGGLFGGELETEEEQFLGGLIGKLFGGTELEAESYVQDQFLGGIVKSLLGGEIAGELPGERPGPRRRLGRARRFVRLATHASRQAAAEIVRLLQSGQRPTEDDVRRIIVGAMIATARRFRHRRRHHHHRLSEPAAPTLQPSPPPRPPQGETLLERMIAGARPLGAY